MMSEAAKENNQSCGPHHDDTLALLESSFEQNFLFSQCPESGGCNRMLLHKSHKASRLVHAFSQKAAEKCFSKFRISGAPRVTDGNIPL